MTDNFDFDWGELGAGFWLDAAKSIGATERHAKFACSKHNGKTNTQAARDAGYGVGGTNPGSVRSEGYRLFRSNKITQLLSLAAAEAGGGIDGCVTPQEAKQILSHLARGSDPSIRVKALESLAKMQDREQELIRNQPEETLEQTLGHIIVAVPYQAFGAFMSLSSFISGGGFLGSFPFLSEVAPAIARYYPDQWQKWRIREKQQWVLDFLDKAASGPVLDDDELVAVVKRKIPTAVIAKPPKPTEATNDAA
jgi:hypothetical protein